MRKKCLICEQNKLKKILSLGKQPFADTFINKSDLKKKEPVKNPLKLPVKLPVNEPVLYDELSKLNEDDNRAIEEESFKRLEAKDALSI